MSFVGLKKVKSVGWRKMARAGPCPSAGRLSQWGLRNQ